MLQRLFVWPNRLVIPMRSRNHPLIKPILPSIQPHIKGIVAVVVKRGAGLPIPCAAPSQSLLCSFFPRFWPFLMPTWMFRKACVHCPH